MGKKNPAPYSKKPVRKSLGEQTEGLVLMRRVCASPKLFSSFFGVGGGRREGVCVCVSTLSVCWNVQTSQRFEANSSYF